MRQSKINNYMEMAEIVAKRSHDSETKVGAVLVNNNSGAVIATGFNGFVRGAPDNTLPSTRPLKYEFIIHAEQNLIANCAYHGISTRDCYMVTTMSPCKLCMRLMVSSGITKVITEELYKDFQGILDMPDIKTNLIERDDGLYEITYAMGN